MNNLTTKQLLKIAWKISKVLDGQAALLATKPENLKTYSESSYGSAIVDAARAYWKEGSRGNFFSRMNALIKFGLNDAWVKGAREMGVEPDEFTQDDINQINAIIAEEKSHVADLLEFLDGLANDPKRTLADAEYRLRLWANRFADVYNQALIYFGGKKRLKWVLGAAENHCESCSRLNGIVAWAMEWEQSGIHPQSHELSCGGWNCKCSLQPTSQRRSPRALSRILDIVTAGRL